MQDCVTASCSLGVVGMDVFSFFSSSPAVMIVMWICRIVCRFLWEIKLNERCKSGQDPPH